MSAFEKIRNWRGNERGATAVEFAVVAALLFIIFFGILEFSFIFLQEHYIANAAREGIRIGVRANNFNCFESTSEKGCVDVTPAASRVFRKQAIINEIKIGVTRVDGTTRDPYLVALYGRNNPNVTVVVGRNPDDAEPDNTQKALIVTVTAPNVFPPILTSLVKLIPGAGFELPATITYTATGDYEDPSEP
jgi:Flp pilus assembly protein TadG